MQYEDDLKKQYRSTAILAYVLIACIAFYGALSLILIKFVPRASQSLGTLNLLRTILLIISVAGLACIPLIKPFILNRNLPQKDEAPSDQRARIYITRLHSSTVATLALCENPALFGCVLAFLKSNMNEYYLFAAMAAFGLIMNFPQYEQWERWINEKMIG